MGSTVVYGRGRMVVTQTGMDTEMGKIADALANAQEGQTPLQIKLTQLSGILTKLVLVICVLIFGVQLLRAGEFTLEVVMHSFMIAVSLAVAAIPEGLAAEMCIRDRCISCPGRMRPSPPSAGGWASPSSTACRP